MTVRAGLEALLEDPSRARTWGDCALLVNQASVDAAVRPSQLLLRGLLGPRLRLLFTPQHGLCAEKQDNMVESAHSVDFASGLPFFSLYSEVREPTPAMLEGIDTVIVDMQDVGTRVYTFVWTMAAIMRACGRLGKRVVVLDRPNPIGGEAVEGNVLAADSRSFVGEEPMPMRHGMTIAEIARWLRSARGLALELETVPMLGWERWMHYADTGRPWVITSPNMPTAGTCLLYPGTVLLEGSNLSEGRGTTTPFMVAGAPWVRDPGRLARMVRSVARSEGVAVQPTAFEPTFQKWAGKNCLGVRFVPLDPRAVRPYRLGLCLLAAAAALAPEDFRFNPPPYEYEYVRPPIQLLLGDSSMASRVEHLFRAEDPADALDALEEEWRPRLNEFLKERAEVLLYE